MGNTPLHSKRRLSGDMDEISRDNTPPHIAVDIPAKRPTLCTYDAYPHSAPIDSRFAEPYNDPNLDEMLGVDSMAWLLHGASLRDVIGPSVGEILPATRPICPNGGMVGDCQSSFLSNPPNFDSSSSIETDRPTQFSKAKLNLCARTTKHLLPTVFRWNGGGNEVFISGTFNNWQSRIPMVRRNSGTCVIVDCPPGFQEYKFFIDGAWYHDPTKPAVDNQYGTKNNVLEVKETDFDFLIALEQDIANSKHSVDSAVNSDFESGTPPGEYGCFVPEQPKDVYTHSKTMSLSSYSPRRVPSIPPAPGVGSINQPPLLPPQLLQGILNKDIGVHCDPNLLPPPNHVMLNHLYALSIKDGVIVLSVITRYRQKFVSTLFYKPIPN